MTKTPNMLVLVCDHHRFDALGCLGNPLARTPNLDRLATKGTRFENCFTQSPVCSPARHSMATGQYAHAHGVVTNNHKPSSPMTTIAHALQPLGYRRINVGHMHWQEGTTDTGYEPWIKPSGWRDAMPQALRDRWDWEAQGTTRRTTGGPSPRAREQNPGFSIAETAIAQMEDAVAKDEPFLCWTAFAEPHPPFYPPAELYRTFDQSQIPLPRQAPPGTGAPHEYITEKRKEWAHLSEIEVRQILAGYYGLVALVDGYIGTVLDALERLGIRDDTIIIWTSDHGDQMWEHEMFLKFCMYEASVHVPLVVHVPGAESGTRSELVEHIDLLPTICELTGAEIPSSAQGRSLRAMLEGGGPGDTWRDAVYSQIGNVQMIRTADWKLIAYEGEPGELYDLESDPNEFDNRIADPACRDTVESMFSRLRVWESENAAP